MNHNIYIFILVSAIVSYLIRVIPMTLIRKPINNKFIRSFLYYVPYATLAVMTFPAMIEATQSKIAGTASLLCGIIAAWFDQSLFKVAIICCIVVFVMELILI